MPTLHMHEVLVFRVLLWKRSNQHTSLSLSAAAIKTIKRTISNVYMRAFYSFHYLLFSTCDWLQKISQHPLRRSVRHQPSQIIYKRTYQKVFFFIMTLNIGLELKCYGIKSQFKWNQEFFSSISFSKISHIPIFVYPQQNDKKTTTILYVYRFL